MRVRPRMGSACQRTPASSSNSSTRRPVTPPVIIRANASPLKACTTRATLIPPPPGSSRSSNVRILCVGRTAAAVEARSTAGFSVSVTICAHTSALHYEVVFHLGDAGGGPCNVLRGLAFIDAGHVAGQDNFAAIYIDCDPRRMQPRVTAEGAIDLVLDLRRCGGGTEHQSIVHCRDS